MEDSKFGRIKSKVADAGGHSGEKVFFTQNIRIFGTSQIAYHLHWTWRLQLRPSMQSNKPNSVIILSLVTYCVQCVGLRDEEPQAAHAMSFTWACHIATSVLTGC